MRLTQLAALAAGELRGTDAAFSRVSIDTRSLQAGDVFFAISGPRFDGHDFVAAGQAAGACAAVVQRPLADCALPQVVVADVRIALGQLGAAWRQSQPAKVVGLTGSNGKTTAKEMISAILGVDAPVLATHGNLNNDYGVPLTLMRIAPEHRYAVIEMGANHLHEIEYVAGLAKPDVALITNAGDAHLEGFGSREGVARGKGEIISALGADGTAVLNADDAFFEFWCGLAGARRRLSFGFSPQASVRGVADSVRGGWGEHGFQTHFAYEFADQRHAVTLNLAGRHNVANALGAAACALALDIPPAQIAAGLARLAPVPGRMQPTRAAGGAVLINDTYNANPSSFEAALAVLTGLPGEPWLALGAFGELGDNSAALHAELGIQAKAAGVARLYATGPNAEQAVAAFGSGAAFFARQEDLIEQLQQALRDDVALLVKGSRSQRMERVVEALRAGTE